MFTLETKSVVEKLLGASIDDLLAEHYKHKEKVFNNFTGEISRMGKVKNQIIARLAEKGMTWQEVENELANNINNEFCLCMTKFGEKIVPISSLKAGEISQTGKFLHMRMTNRLLSQYKKNMYNRMALEEQKQTGDFPLLDGHKVFADYFGMSSDVGHFITLLKDGEYYADVITEYNRKDEAEINMLEIPNK